MSMECKRPSAGKRRKAACVEGVTMSQTTTSDTQTEKNTNQKRKRKAGSYRGFGYLQRRVAFYLLTIFVACTLNFIIPRLMPGDPVDALVKKIERQTGSPVSPEQEASFRAFFGDTKSNIGQQYIDYWGRLIRLDLGVSTNYYPVPVVKIIGAALPWTLWLAGSSVIIAFLLGTIIGAIVGMRPGRVADSTLLPTAAFFGALPPFWVAMLLIYYVAFKTGWFPITGVYSTSVKPGLNLPFILSVLHYGLLPLVATISTSVGFWVLQMRNMTVTTASEDYVLLAQAKGLRRSQVIFRYAVRNALLPPITHLATALGSTVGGLLFTELVFNYPGVGSVLIQAVTAKDYPVMQGVFLIITLSILLGNFIADTLYVILDPRTRGTNR